MPERNKFPAGTVMVLCSILIIISVFIGASFPESHDFTVPLGIFGLFGMLAAIIIKGTEN